LPNWMLSKQILMPKPLWIACFWGKCGEGVARCGKMHKSPFSFCFGAMVKSQSIILVIVALGTLMGALDSTIVLLAFPAITDGLHSDFITTIWIILAYLLVIAVTTTQLGRIGDIYGRSTMFNTGFALFTVGSALCGFSPNIYFLIGSRVVQALGGALMQSNSGAVIADTFPANERGKAYGYNSLGFTVGSMLGIVLGGVLATFIWWQSIFFINIPIGAFALFFGFKYLKDAPKVKAKIDLGGMALLATSLMLISYGATNFASQGLTAINAALMLLGVVFIPVFVWYEKRLQHPMVDFAAFKDTILRNSCLATFFVSVGYMSIAFLITMYLQGVRGLSPLDAALLLTPGYVVGSFFSPLMGRYSDKVGARIIATLGIVCLGVAALIYITLNQNSPFYVILVASAVSGIGTSMFFPANNAAVMSKARQGNYGSISGVLRTLQNIGILGSFVLAISVASASIPRELAFQIFINTVQLSGNLSSAFITGIVGALVASIILLAVAAVLSATRGKESRTENS
jgi:EmrB/QacA subfamily drug resistance transporter